MLRLTACLLLAAGLLSLAATPAEAHPAGAPVISQAYGGGGNAGAPYRNDFIEVFNRQGAPIDLTGYSVQYAAATSNSWVVTPLSGTLEIGEYLLVAEGGGGVIGSPLPAADATGTVDMGQTAGKVALVSSFFPLSGTCPSGSQILDLVGYGTTANCFEGAGPTANTSNTTAALRKTAGCTDTNSNTADFQVLAPNPRNSASSLNLCFPVPSQPVLGSTAPASPGNTTTPRVIGSAGAGTTVEVYDNATCSGAPLASGSAAQFASPGIAVTVPANSTTTFRALAFDSNNTSACSSSALTYVEDSVAPSAPIIHVSAPVSPANNNSPSILGSAEAGATVRLYANAACSGAPLGSGTAAQFASPGIAVTVADDSTTTIYAAATDAAGNTSACSSSSLTYVEDSTPPPQPTLTSSAPASPANNNNPSILGSAQAGATVKLYANATCSGAPLASGPAAQFASPGIAVTVADNSATTIWATATDAVGNVSACSSSSLTYVEDSSLPPEPTLTSSDPASPANNVSPKLIGSAQAGTTVDLYANGTCSGIPVASGTAAQLATPGIAVLVSPNSTTTFHATATNSVGTTSACSSSSLTYVEDSAPPPQPTFTSSAPPSPANNNNPSILGSAQAGATVKLYADVACSGIPVASGTAAQFASPGIAVTVADDATTTFHATATNSVGTTSACSSSSLTYVEDSTPPPQPTFTSSSPASPANNTSPDLIGSAQAGTTVDLYANATCSGAPAASGPAAQFASPGIAVTVAGDSTTTFHATATDAAGNTSGCSSSSLTYVEDSTPPPQPTFTSSSPASPANNSHPSILGSAEAGTTVKLYDNGACSGTPLASGPAAQFASPGIAVTVVNDSTTTIHATATDAAGNTSACSSNSLTYVEDSSLPPEPTFSFSNPASPANDVSPALIGSAQAGTTVNLYANAACSGIPAASGSAAQFASPGIVVLVLPNSTTTFHATATNPVGTTSACSSDSLTYIDDSAVPPPPTLSSTDPASPSTSLTPKLIGSAQAGTTVDIYDHDDCSGAPVTSGTAAQFASPGITVTVAHDSSNHFHATATSPIGNVSACSSTSLTYVQADSEGPVVSGLRMVPNRFAVSPTKTSVGTRSTASRTLGSTIDFTLSREASASFTIRRRPPRQQLPSTNGSLVKNFGRLLEPGQQLVPFSGRLGNRIFRPGPYRLYVTAIDRAGRTSTRVSTKFEILP